MLKTGKSSVDKICGECTVQLAEANRHSNACSNEDGQAFSEHMQACILNALVDGIDANKLLAYQEEACGKCPKLMENLAPNVFSQLVNSEASRSDSILPFLSVRRREAVGMRHERGQDRRIRHRAQAEEHRETSGARLTALFGHLQGS